MNKRGKKANSRQHFNYIRQLVKCKRSQAQIITTVLLILISIGAIAVVAVFIFGLVSKNLGSTDCFDTVAQFEIKAGEEGSTCYDVDEDTLTLTIERGQKSFNLTAFSVVAGDDLSSKAYDWADDLPGPGEKRTKVISVDAGKLINSVSVTPILGKSTRCGEGMVQSSISAC